MSGEVGVRLTGDNSEFKSMLNDSVGASTEFAGKLTEKVGDKLLGLRDMSHAIATALGLNYEKIAEGLARTLTGMSKETEELYKKLGELDDATTAKNIANNQLRLTDNQKFQLASQQLIQMEKELSNLISQKAAMIQHNADMQALAAKSYGQWKTDEVALGVKDLAIAKERDAIADKRKETETYLSNLRKEAPKQEREIMDAEKAADDAAEKSSRVFLDAAAKRKALEEDIFAIDYDIGTSLLTASELVTKINEKSKLQGEIAELNRAGLEKTRVAAEAIEKATYENLTNEQKRQNLLAIIASYEEAIKNNQAAGRDVGEQQNQLALKKVELDKINLAIAKAKTDEETKQLEATKQYLSMTPQQLEAAKKRVDLAILNAEAEGRAVDGLKEQLAVILHIIDAEKQRAGLSVSGSEDVKSESTDALLGNLRRVQQQLSGADSTGTGQIRNATISGNYSDFLVKSLLDAQAGAIQAELNLRAQVQSYANAYGQAAAVQQYGDQITSRALSAMNDTATKTLSALGQLNQRLQNNGAFPLT